MIGRVRSGFYMYIMMIFAAVMTAMYVIQKRHLKRLNEDLEEVLTKGSCRRILLSAPDKEMERLLVMLNRYIEACQNEKAAMRQGIRSLNIRFPIFPTT